jgi:hypothetical protein
MSMFYAPNERFRNHFIPCFELLRKECIGARVQKINGGRKTPCQRLLEPPDTTLELARPRTSCETGVTRSVCPGKSGGE